MDRELEIAGAASAGGWMRWRKHETLPLGTPCPNCATPLAGPYCHECGQLGEQFNRSLLHLAYEAFENFFHVDGRLVHTMPRLVLHPGRLTTDYIEGRRAAQIPPLRLFLVVMLIFFFVGGLKSTHENIKVAGPEQVRASAAVPQDVKSRLPKTNEDAGPVWKWLKPRVQYASAHPREFSMVFESWTHRIAIAMLPVAAAILSLLFVFKRRFYVYDHLIFAMHSLSFMGMLASLQSLVGIIPGVGSLSDLILFAAPVHLFVHMRGVYGIGVFGALWRMVVLFLLSSLALGLMMGAVVMIGLNEMDTSSAAKAAARAPVDNYLKLD